MFGWYFSLFGLTFAFAPFIAPQSLVNNGGADYFNPVQNFCCVCYKLCNYTLLDAE